MADSKVSGLSAGSTLSGTEVVPCVQAGASVKATVNQLSVAAQTFAAATQTDMESASDATKNVTASAAHYHPSSAKCWLKCGVSADITVSYNITSLSDGGAGIVTVTIGNDFSSANWCAVTGGLGAGTAVTNAALVSTSSQAAGTIVLSNYDASATPVLEDPSNFFFAGFGDL